ncbi:MAG TPA: hypothetical protein VGL70_09260, partial [Candidatus Binatia bacterium]
MMVRIISLTVLCGLAFFFVPDSVWGQSDHTASLVEGAKRERKLVWYTSMAATESKPLLDSFMQRYPYVQVE